MSRPRPTWTDGILFSCLPLAVLPMAQTSQMESRLRATYDQIRRQKMVTRTFLAASVLASLAVLAPLAALRPEAQAAVRVTAQALSAPTIPDTPATAAAKLHRLYPLIIRYRQRHGGQFPATFPNGLEADSEGPACLWAAGSGRGELPAGGAFLRQPN